MMTFGFRHNHSQLTTQDGFLLLSILILILILSLFGLYALVSAGLSIKMQTDAWEENNLRSTANAILNSIEKKIDVENVNCFIHTGNPNFFTTRPLTWWETYSCTGIFKHIHYFYVIEDLGIDACAKTFTPRPGTVKQGHDQEQVHQPPQDFENIQYYRITLLSLIPNRSNIILESTIAKIKKRACLENKIICNDQKYHVVALGKQMQRELNRRVTT